MYSLMLFKVIAVSFLIGPLGSFTKELSTPEKHSEELPYIILFMDVNKTIIAEHQKKGLDIDQGLPALLSMIPDYAHTWEDGDEKTTYYTWVNEKLFPGSRKDPVLKKKCESYHSGFVEAAKNHKHPMAQEIIEEFELLRAALQAQQPRSVFTSFSNLVAYLKEKECSFSVVLRTLGSDLEWVVEELAQDGLVDFIVGSFSKDILYLDNKVISDPAEIISAFEPGKQYAIKDNYEYWKEHNFTEKGGKPFPINIADKKILSLFFDDNANKSDRQILHIIPIEKEASLNELLAMGRIVAVDTRKAIGDRSYFITAFENALKQWRDTP